jgi:hypothetical protein
MNSSRRRILSLKVHRLVPIRHRFAFRGESFGFYQAHRQKVRHVCAENGMPSGISRPRSARASLQARKQKLKSP